MNIFEIQEEKNEHRELAKGMIAYGNQVASELQRLFDYSREMLWNRPGFKVADAQKVLDELDSLRPNTAINMFRYHGAFGQFLTSMGLRTEEQVQAPITWEPVLIAPATETSPAIYSIKLIGERYPTEPLPEEEVNTEGPNNNGDKNEETESQG